MGKFSALLSKKVAGIPVSYIAALAVVGLAYYAYHMSSASDTSSTDTSTADTSTADTSTTDTSANDTTSADFTANPTPTYDSSTADTTTVDTNAAWEKRGIEWAVAQGLGTAGDVQVALESYLAGNQLSYEQGKIRDACIKQFGVPPELPASGGTSAPVAKRQVTPPGYHTVQGANDNGYGEIAKLYYGSTAGDRIDLLQIHNMSLGEAGPFAKGTRVFVPKYTVPAYATAKKGRQTLHEFAVAGGISSAAIQQLNDEKKFPVKIGTKVRIG